MLVTPAIGASTHRLLLSRRMVLGSLVAAGSLVGSRALALQPGPNSLVFRGTPQMTIGPFYPLDRPAEEDADLTRILGREDRANGTIIDLVGRVLTEAGKPVPGALIDMWQTNSMGSYHHPADPTGAGVDPAFQGAAVLRSDAEGRYRLRTVIPGPYVSRVRHIHFDVRGQKRRLITQMFFPGEPNESDYLYRSLRFENAQRAVTANLSDKSLEKGVPLYRWDIVLAGE